MDVNFESQQQEKRKRRKNGVMTAEVDGAPRTSLSVLQPVYTEISSCNPDPQIISLWLTHVNWSNDDAKGISEVIPHPPSCLPWKEDENSPLEIILQIRASNEASYILLILKIFWLLKTRVALIIPLTHCQRFSHFKSCPTY